MHHHTESWFAPPADGTPEPERERRPPPQSFSADETIAALEADGFTAEDGAIVPAERPVHRPEGAPEPAPAPSAAALEWDLVRPTSGPAVRPPQPPPSVPAWAKAPPPPSNGGTRSWTAAPRPTPPEPQPLAPEPEPQIAAPLTLEPQPPAVDPVVFEPPEPPVVSQVDAAPEESWSAANEDDFEEPSWAGHPEADDTHTSLEAEWFGPEGGLSPSVDEEAWSLPAPAERVTDPGSPASSGSDFEAEDDADVEPLEMPLHHTHVEAVTTTPPEAADAEGLDDLPRPAPRTRVVRARVASIPARAIAWSLDGMLLLTVLGAVCWMAGRVVGSPVGPAEAARDPLLLAALLGLASLLGAVYTVVATVAGGQTLGARVAGIRVLDGTGNPPRPGRAVLRAALAVPGALLFLVGWVWVLLDDRGQALHDRLSRTFVVES